MKCIRTIATIMLVALFATQLAHAQQDKLDKLNSDLEKVAYQEQRLKSMLNEAREEMKQAREKGDTAATNKAAVRVAAVEQQIEQTVSARRQLEASITAVTNTENRQRAEEARARQQEGERRVREARQRERGGDAANRQNRLEHLRQARMHLSEAGANDLAEMVERQIGELERQGDRDRPDRPREGDRARGGDRARDRDQPDRPRESDRARPDRERPRLEEGGIGNPVMNQRDREILNAISELNQAVKQLKEQVDQLRRGGGDRGERGGPAREGGRTDRAGGQGNERDR